MTYKNFIKSTILFSIIILISTLIITILYHNNILNNKTVKILELTSLLLSSVSSGLYIGYKSKNKAYINGLILGSIIISILMICNLLIFKKIKLISLFLYIIILIIIIISSIIGINKRR